MKGQVQVWQDVFLFVCELLKIFRDVAWALGRTVYRIYGVCQLPAFQPQLSAGSARQLIGACSCHDATGNAAWLLHGCHEHRSHGAVEPEETRLVKV